MARMCVKTKGNVDPGRLQCVYFTCHPADFEKYFEMICEDIFKTHNCAVYYTDDMTEAINDEHKKQDLDSKKIFIVPVTFKLLTEANRAMDEDVPYALANHITILPFMMELGIDSIYARPDKFGDIQYLNPISTDITEIGYAEKLKKQLDILLVSEEKAKQIRAAFDAYIFLSYRKKDRKYANKLIHLIHSNPKCWDVAVWYDEFLTPGKNFKENIQQVLKQCRVFAMVVTPNLLEEPNGKPNFIMTDEYPAAYEFGIDILPVEMEITDKEELQLKFTGIPSCIDFCNEEIYKSLLTMLKMNGKTEERNDPLRNYLIGCAYLNGIDMEIDREKAVRLVTEAAEQDFGAAMLQLYNMYNTGDGVPLNWKMAVYWEKRLVEHLRKHFGEDDEMTLWWTRSLAKDYIQLGEYEEAKKISEEVYALQCSVLGEEDPETIESLSVVASVYYFSGEYEEALNLSEKAYAVQCRITKDNLMKSTTSLNVLAITTQAMGKIEKALALFEKAYTIQVKILGIADPITLASLNNLAMTYVSIKDYAKALKLYKKAYAILCKELGEEHPNTLHVLDNMAAAYAKSGDINKALELHGKAYALYRRVLGEEHPDTLVALANIAAVRNALGDYVAALELYGKVYPSLCNVLGAENANTLQALDGMACSYGLSGDIKKALKMEGEAYAFRCKVLGEEHPDTLNSLLNMVYMFSDFEDSQSAVEFLQRTYEEISGNREEGKIYTIEVLNRMLVCCREKEDYLRELDMLEAIYILRYKVDGEAYVGTVAALENVRYAWKQLSDIAFDQLQNNNSEAGIDLLLRVYDSSRKILGEKDITTYGLLTNLAAMCIRMGKYFKALELEKKIYVIVCELQGKESPTALTTLNIVAQIYKKMGEYQEALELQKEVFQLRRKIMGEEHVDTIASLNNLAYLYREIGEKQEALKLFKKVYGYWKRKFSEEHPKALTAMHNIGVTYGSLGEYEQAVALLRRTYDFRCKVLGCDSRDTVETLDALETTRKKWDMSNSENV